MIALQIVVGESFGADVKSTSTNAPLLKDVFYIAITSVFAFACLSPVK